MTAYGFGWIILGGFEWLQMVTDVSGGFRWFQVVSGGFGKFAVFSYD